MIRFNKLFICFLFFLGLHHFGYSRQDDTLKNQKQHITIGMPWLGVEYSYFIKPKHALEGLVRLEPNGWFIGVDYAYHWRLTLSESVKKKQSYIDLIFGLGLFTYEWLPNQTRAYIPSTGWQTSSGVFPIIGGEIPLSINKKSNFRLKAFTILDRFYFDGYSETDLRQKDGQKFGWKNFFSGLFYGITYVFD